MRSHEEFILCYLSLKKKREREERPKASNSLGFERILVEETSVVVLGWLIKVWVVRGFFLISLGRCKLWPPF